MNKLTLPTRHIDLLSIFETVGYDTAEISVPMLQIPNMLSPGAYVTRVHAEQPDRRLELELTVMIVPEGACLFLTANQFEHRLVDELSSQKRGVIATAFTFNRSRTTDLDAPAYAARYSYLQTYALNQDAELNASFESSLQSLATLSGK